ESFDRNEIGIGKLNLNEPGHNRKEGERHSGRVALGSSDEGLADDIDRDENKYGRDHGTWNEFHNEADISKDAAHTNEQARHQCVSRPASHLILRRLSYARLGLMQA